VTLIPLLECNVLNCKIFGSLYLPSSPRPYETKFFERNIYSIDYFDKIRQSKIGRIWLDPTAMRFDGGDNNTVVQRADFQNSYPLLLLPYLPT